MFTFKAKACFKPYCNIRVKDHAIRVKTQALIASVSLKEGLEDYSIHPKSIKIEEFQAFLHELSAGFDSQSFAIFLDKLSVHKTKSRDLFAELQIMPIFNVPY